MHEGEPIEEAAQRELAEEVGMHAGRLIPLTSYSTSKSVIEETARHLPRPRTRPGTREADETEHLVVSTVRFTDALEMVLSGEIVDSMTIIAVLWADRLRTA